MRIVIDTNVLVSFLFWPESALRPIVEQALLYAEVLRSTETFAELAEVIMRRKFDPYLSSAERELFLASFYDNSQHVLITRRIDACRDAEDNKFLELAVCGNAALLLTGDKDLLELDAFEDVRIISPAIIGEPYEP